MQMYCFVIHNVQGFPCFARIAGCGTFYFVGTPKPFCHEEKGQRNRAHKIATCNNVPGSPEAEAGSL